MLIGVANKGAVYASDAFAEQLVQFDTLGFYFERPSLEANISMIGVAIEEETPSADAHADTEIEQTAHAAAVGVTPTVERAENVPFFRKRDRLSPEEVALVHRPMAYYKVLRAKLRTYKTVAASQIVKLINAKLAHNASIALCPQHMPKFHPDFDAVLTGILIHSPNTRIALIDNRKKMQWRLTLTQRWRLTLTEFLTLSAPTESDIGAESSVSVQDTVDSLLSRIVWISAMSPQEYLHLLAVGDVMLDPFPFGGGVTTLESVAVCTPVVTLPSAQSVPQLAAGTVLLCVVDVLLCTSCCCHSFETVCT